MQHHLSIDLETFSSVPLQKAGAHKYIQSPDFQILLFAYSLDGGPVEIIDLAQGETLPPWLAAALSDPSYIKHAYNASFEWGCLSKFMGQLPVDQWRCTMVLDAPAAKAYKQLEREMLLEMDEGVITAGTAGVLTGKLLQLCNGAVYDGERQALDIHKCKVEAFTEVLEQLHGQSALVFYNFQHDRDRLLSVLEPMGLRVRVYQNAQDETDWNNGEIDVLLAHPASCAYGLNLQNGGHHIIWFGLTWSLEQYEQANKRLHRQGQKHPVVIHLLVVQGGMDEDVITALQRKEDTQGALMDALRVRIKKAKEGAA